MELKNSNILIKFEGGLGDCLLANRFVPAIKEKHPNSQIYCALKKNEVYQNDVFQIEVLSHFYKEFYDSFIMFDESLIEKYDHFYNLHIDKMKWSTYDFDWFSRFYYFPKPKIKVEKKDIICLHLTHNKWAPKNLRKKYITALVDELLNITPNIVAICTESEKERYDEVKDKIKIHCSNVISACEVVASSRVFITIDSGFKYIAYAYGVPTIETADYYFEPGATHPMVKARWLPFQERGLPLYSDPKLFKIALKNILENRISSFCPLAKDIKAAFKL